MFLKLINCLYVGETVFCDTGDFFKFPLGEKRSMEMCCNDDHLQVCREVEFEPRELSKGNMRFNGIDFTFSNEVQPHGFVYKNKFGDEAIIDFHEKTGNLFGSINTHDGHSYAVEKCKAGHIWKEFDTSSFEKNLPIRVSNANRFSKREVPQLSQDRTTIKTYSIMVYYTPEFASVTEDIEGWVDLVLEEANQGYINSNIPVRVEKFCIEAATIGDKESHPEIFRMMKGSPTATRNTADAAVLFSVGCPPDDCWCGVAWIPSPLDGDWTFSVTRKSCALGAYTFGHELGHNFQCHHNIEQDKNYIHSYGHGHLIAAGKGVQGSTTILAYTRRGHGTRANYYSDPDQTYPPTGTPLGVKGVSDNVRVITDNRFAFAAIGDESGECKDKRSEGSNTLIWTKPITTRSKALYVCRVDAKIQYV